jgi:hypothetical protein
MAHHGLTWHVSIIDGTWVGASNKFGAHADTGVKLVLMSLDHTGTVQRCQPKS